MSQPSMGSGGNWLFMCVVLDKDWPAAAKALGRPELSLDARFTDGAKRSANASQLVAILDETFAAQPLKYWRERPDGGPGAHRTPPTAPAGIRAADERRE